MDKDSVVVYWAPSMFANEVESWNMLYPTPQLVKSQLQSMHTDLKRNMHACPALKDSLKNVYALKSAVKEDIDLPSDYLREIHLNEGTEPFPSFNNQIVRLNKERASSLIGYSNLCYNLGWVFFSEEPLIANFTAPYMPASSPSPGAILACGEFDIGKWFRPFNFDYHIPLDNTSFKVEIGQDLAYVKFKTEKKVVLKRFSLNKVLFNYATETAQSSSRYSQFVPLLQRYEMAKNSKMTNLVLKEIKNNLID